MKRTEPEPQFYSEAFKKQAVKIIAEKGQSTGKVAKSFGVSMSLVEDWKREFGNEFGLDPTPKTKLPEKKDDSEPFGGIGRGDRRPGKEESKSGFFAPELPSVSRSRNEEVAAPVPDDIPSESKQKSSEEYEDLGELSEDEKTLSETFPALDFEQIEDDSVADPPEPVADPPEQKPKKSSGQRTSEDKTPEETMAYLRELEKRDRPQLPWKPVVLFLALVTLCGGLFYVNMQRSSKSETEIAESDAAPQPEVPGLSPEELINAFVSAKSVDEGLAFVRAPQQVRPSIEQYMANKDHLRTGRFKEKKAISKTVNGKPFLVVEGEFLPTKKTITYLLEAQSSGYKIDWEVSHDFQPVDWVEYRRSQPTVAQAFRVIIRESNHFEAPFDASEYKAFHLSYPGKLAFLYGFAAKDSDVARKLTTALIGKEAAAYIVEMRYPEGEGSPEAVELTRWVQDGWIVDYDLQGEKAP